MGQVASEFTFSHEVFGEGFYMVDVLVKRLSSSEDRIPLMISERLIDVTQDYTGEFIMASGQFRSYNRHDEQKNWTGRRPIPFCWTAISVSFRFTGKRRWGGRLRIFCSPLTALTGNRITSHVSAGGETPGTHPPLRWGNMCRSWEGSRAGNT